MTKKILVAVAVLLFLIPASLQAREVIRLTRYMGQSISGVTAGDRFKVELVKSTETKAVVEIDGDLEQYLRFELRPDGTVSVKLSIPDNERRRLERLVNWKDRILQLTVYLPELNTIQLSEMARLTTNDSFAGQAIRIKAQGMGKIDKLSLQAEQIAIELDDMSAAILTLQAGTVTAEAHDMSRITLTGQAREARTEAKDMSRINGDGFRVERAHIQAADMSKNSIHATQYLYARASDMSSVSYEGTPREIDLKTPRRTINTRAE